MGQKSEGIEDQITQFIAAGEWDALMFQPSGALRWVRREKSLVLGTESLTVDYEHIVLQQEWVNVHTGERDWWDVPMVEEGMKE